MLAAPANAEAFGACEKSNERSPIAIALSARPLHNRAAVGGARERVSLGEDGRRKQVEDGAVACVLLRVQRHLECGGLGRIHCLVGGATEQRAAIGDGGVDCGANQYIFLEGQRCDGKAAKPMRAAAEAVATDGDECATREGARDRADARDTGPAVEAQQRAVVAVLLAVERNLERFVHDTARDLSVRGSLAVQGAAVCTSRREHVDEAKATAVVARIGKRPARDRHVGVTVARAATWAHHGRVVTRVEPAGANDGHAKRGRAKVGVVPWRRRGAVLLTVGGDRHAKRHAQPCGAGDKSSWRQGGVGPVGIVACGREAPDGPRRVGRVDDRARRTVPAGVEIAVRRRVRCGHHDRSVEAAAAV
eukprot:1248160-Prymnesium_polylepis.2